ncbi:Molybdopterin biosynthesis protein MoeA [Dissulfuribacter thermophilus]|uniref:Molybdopterin biosynthesis protein MoeA n=1 Tax=Dissulfuribacter thermophilus TaxID=1156395 RepID=A0A1B9F776_9BACT|nr:molybdopterin-binding protein [Dissulfuribacter thermophilus]OCC15704.1 Molybdopterin biosynthesis protein MoeA [Dissulfuribacter thermophilus]
MSLKKVPVEEAVGMILPHDITEIVPGKKKGPAFRKGHVIRPEDVEHLKRLGKEHIFCLELEEGELHEDDAALRLARAVAGPNILWDEDPKEGKVGFRAKVDGLFKVDVEGLYKMNLLGEVMLSTIHNNTVVRAGDQVAAGRAIPLIIKESIIDEVESIGESRGGLISIAQWKIKRGAIVITGREVFEGRVKDAFGKRMAEKLSSLGIIVVSTVLCPDEPERIAQEIRAAIDRGAEMVLCTGGMSVDPDDVTRYGIRLAGGTDEVYGSPVLPGAMFLVSYINDIPILGIPACGMYFKVTVLDLILPRVVAGERITREKIAALGHGGLCLNCKSCKFPVCPFGKGGG